MTISYPKRGLDAPTGELLFEIHSELMRRDTEMIDWWAREDIESARDWRVFKNGNHRRF